MDNSSNNTSNNSLINLFQDSEDVTPTPSPFNFGPLPPSPDGPPPPSMEIIMEVTETGTTSSENASTEIEILEEFVKPIEDTEEEKKPDVEEKLKVVSLQGYSCQSGGEKIKVKNVEAIDICEKITEVTNEEKRIKEYQNMIKQRKEDLKTFVNRHIDDNEVFRRYIEDDEVFRKYIENENLFRSSSVDKEVSIKYKEDEEDLSICDCPAHLHDKEYPLELVEVSTLNLT